MVFDRRFTAASPRYLGFSGPAEYRHRRAMPVTEYLCPLDPALLNGVRCRGALLQFTMTSLRSMAGVGIRASMVLMSRSIVNCSTTIVGGPTKTKS